MNPSDIERRVQQVEWPEPTETLRTRVLSLAVPAHAVSWTDHVWFSRAWRLSAASLIAGLVAIELWAGSLGPTRVAPAPRAIAEARALEVTGQELGFPEGTVFALAERLLAAPVQSGRGRQLEQFAMQPFDLEGVRQ
jgi:hypothetical protein